MKDLFVRKPNRLKDYDYSQNGAYFITICVKDRRPLLSQILVGEHSVLPIRPILPESSEIGKIVDTSINNIRNIYNSVEINKYVIMPNHVHMILSISSYGGSTMCSPTVSRIIKQCKEYVTKKIGYSIWQISYHDHIIRDEEDYKSHWQYIDENPAKWAQDCYYTKGL